VLLAVASFLVAGAARADGPGDLVRIEGISGFLNQGSMAKASFALDTSGFGGPVIERSDGDLDVDPSIWYGLRGTYRLNRRLSLALSWMHSRGRYRVQFPALASIEGNFDLEGLILAGEDFITQGSDVRAESAMGDALSDVYLASATYEFSTLDGLLHPFLTAGTGIFRQRSDGDVLQISYETELPNRIETVEALGVNPLAASGLSVFGIDQTNWALSAGGGMRIVLPAGWGASVEIEDVVRMNPDLDYLADRSTPPPDVDQGIPYSTTWAGKDSPIHNFGVRVSVEYAVWPYGRPR
jgi:hypothetical protein